MNVLQSLLLERRLRAAVRRLFDPANADGEAILVGLAHFCHARRSSIMVSPQSGQVDSHAMAVAEGRREVFMWLADKARVSDAEIDAAIQRETDLKWLTPQS